MQSPILEDKTDKKHEHPQCPEDRDRGNVSILPVSYPEPPQQKHRQPIDGPQGKDAPYRIFAREFPGSPDGVTKNLACRAIKR